MTIMRIIHLLTCSTIIAPIVQYAIPFAAFGRSVGSRGGELVQYSNTIVKRALHGSRAQNKCNGIQPGTSRSVCSSRVDRVCAIYKFCWLPLLSMLNRTDAMEGSFFILTAEHPQGQIGGARE